MKIAVAAANGKAGKLIVEEAVKGNYNGSDYHRMYVSEIVKVLVND